MANLFSENSKLIEEEKSQDFIPPASNLNFKKRSKEEMDFKLESIEEKRENEKNVETEVDKIINQDLKNLNEKEEKKNMYKRAREKYSESFYGEGKYAKNKEKINKNNVSAMNMRSFQYDKEDLEKRNYMTKLIEMREENNRLRQENKKMKEKQKNVEENKSEIEKKDVKKDNKKDKKALLKKMNMSIMNLKRDLDESNLEISFLENKGNEKDQKERARNRRKKYLKKNKKNFSHRKRKSYVNLDQSKTFNIENFKKKFKKKISVPQYIENPNNVDTSQMSLSQMSLRDSVNVSIMSTKSRFDELREKRRKKEMEQVEKEKSEREANIAQAGATIDEIKIDQSIDLSNEDNVENEKKNNVENDNKNEDLLKENETYKQKIYELEQEKKNEIALERENEEFREEIEKINEENDNLRLTIEKLNSVIEKMRKDKNGEKSFNEGR